MASPRVFISSTCYDLGQIRDSLSEFIESYCYEPMLSERGDIFFHPDLHTHESCVNEIDNCQLFILLIGGRFGGNYKYDASKSITNAEYEAARLKKIPVFTFIKRDVYEDHRLYQKNKHQMEIVKKIEFPSIENQKYAIDIFEFINQVRLSEVNNGFFPFEFVRDIKQSLGKQWAGMMFDFLNERSRESQQKVVNKTLDNLTMINKKTEELIEGIFKKLNPTSGAQEIKELDKTIEGSKFYSHIFSMFPLKEHNETLENLIKISPDNLEWYEYISNIKGMKLKKPSALEKERGGFKSSLLIGYYGNNFWSVETEDEVYPKDVTIARNLFENILQLNEEERRRALTFITTANSTLPKVGVKSVRKGKSNK
jgi:hypothetical protein